jgi:Putative  PD-(D/E)XK family member, (DUF4420)
MIQDLIGLWTSLEPPAAAGDLIGEAPPGESGDAIKVALDHQGRWHLLLEATAEDKELPVAAIQGLDLRLDTLRVHNRPPARYFDLSCRDDALRSNFAVLAAEVVEAIDLHTPARAALTSILRRWRRFWSNLPGELSTEDIVGLFGELWFIEHWIGPPTRTAIEAWFGPAGDRHDFRWPAASVEVKTTRIRTDGPATHRISRLDQLAAPDEGELYLLSIRLTPDPLATVSLRSSIERLRSLLAPDQDAVLALNDRLATAGVSPVDMERYDQRFRVVAEELYRVGPDFPRLTVDSFAGGLPVGIESVSYSLNLTACSDFLVEQTPGQVAAGLRASLLG